jgi:triacylglycerol esterase/lipase EstA (alpha/beta hydrolase family)
MIARLLKILLALQLLAMAGLWYAARTRWQIESPVQALALAVGILVLFRLLISGHNFWQSWRYRSATPSRYRPRPLDRCRLFLGEFRASMLTSSWDMVRHGPGLHIAPEARGLPLLLLHGYGCNGGYWAPLSRRLRQAHISYFAPDMQPAADASLDDYVPLVQRAVTELCERSGSDRVIIVAHSMGGLVGRAYLREHGSAQVARVITLGTPHHGTALASFGFGLNAQQMQRANAGAHGASAWLTVLAAAESESRRALFTSIFSHHDNIIAPQTSSYLPGAKNIEFGAIGHVALGSNEAVMQCVLDEAALASGAASGTCQACN